MRDKDFERLYAAHAQPLLAFLVYRIGDRPAAEDVLADTFERVLTTRRGFDARRGGEKTWIYTIALNLVRDRARRASVERRIVDQQVRDPVTSGGARRSPFDEIEDRDALRTALSRLSAEEREAISLRYGSDLSAPEVAKVTGEKLTTIEGRIYRALRKLREGLDDLG